MLLDLNVPLDTRLRFQEGNVLVADFGCIEPLIEGKPIVGSEFAWPSLRVALLYGRDLDHLDERCVNGLQASVIVVLTTWPASHA